MGQKRFHTFRELGDKLANWGVTVDSSEYLKHTTRDTEMVLFLANISARMRDQSELLDAIHKQLCGQADSHPIADGAMHVLREPERRAAKEARERHRQQKLAEARERKAAAAKAFASKIVGLADSRASLCREVIAAAQQYARARYALTRQMGEKMTDPNF